MIAGFNPKLDIQPKISELLLRLTESERFPQTYLFYGMDGVGKFYYVMEFVRAIFCQDEVKPCGVCVNCKRISDNNHPDIKIIFPETYQKEFGDEKIKNPFLVGEISKNDKIKVEVFRDLKEFVSLKTFEGGWRVIVIDHYELATTQASNAFLKLLEEPDEHTLIFITASSTSSILPTILSRIQLKVYFPNLSKEALQKLFESNYFEEIEISEKLLSSGSYSKILKERSIIQDNEEIEKVIKSLIVLLQSCDKYEKDVLYKQIYSIRKSLERYSKNRVYFELILNKLYEILYKFIILGINSGKSNLADFFVNLQKYKQIEMLDTVLLGKKMFMSNVNSLNIIQVTMFRLVDIIKE